MVRISIAFLLAIACVSGFAQNKKAAKSQTLFSVKGEPVTTDEFLYLYKKNHQGKDEFSKQKIQEYLDLFINFKLKVKEARHRGIDTTAVFLKEYTSYKEELKKPYLPESKILDSLVTITYNRLQEEVRVSHIIVLLKSDASPADTLQAFNKITEIKKKVDTGEDFSSLAALYSEEPMASASKGDLGYFTAMQMVYTFENAAYSGKPGDIVGPIRSQFGYHILKIIDRKPARGEVEVSHIMIGTKDRTTEKAKDQIFEIYDQLQGGMSWGDLCKQYSDDPGTKNNGGKLRPFGVRAMAGVPEFERVAFSLQKPGDISDPFQTQYGWHIVRLEKKIPLPPFSELSASLRNRVARDERVQVSRQALIQKLKKEYSFSENTSAKSRMMALPDSSLMKGKWKIPAGFSSGKETLFSIRSKKIACQDFLSYISKNQKPTGQQPLQYTEQLYTSFVEKTINDVLEDQIISTHPDFVMLLQEYYEGILLFDIMESEVWKKASDDSTGQQKYFIDHIKDYAADERAVTTIYTSGSAETIAVLKADLEKNDTTSISRLVQSKSVRQEKGTFQKQDRPALAKIEWKPGLYSAENNGIYYLVQIREIVEPGQRSFDEARADVISDYQNYLERNWLELLRTKYPVKINEKARQYVFEKLAP